MARDVTVFAAASLRGALDEIAATHPDDITVSYAGSGLIARQVAQGAPADVVVLAHPIWMDWLDERAQLISQHAHKRGRKHTGRDCAYRRQTCGWDHATGRRG